MKKRSEVITEVCDICEQDPQPTSDSKPAWRFPQQNIVLCAKCYEQSVLRVSYPLVLDIVQQLQKNPEAPYRSPLEDLTPPDLCKWCHLSLEECYYHGDHSKAWR